MVLVGHEADYALDNTGGRYGLLYNRKAPLEGQNQGRFHQALAAAATACTRLEAEVEGLRFSRTELQLLVNDRALAPNTPETLAAVQPELESFLSQLAGEGGFRIEHDPRSPPALQRGDRTHPTAGPGRVGRAAFSRDAMTAARCRSISCSLSGLTALRAVEKDAAKRVD